MVCFLGVSLGHCGLMNCGITKFIVHVTCKHSDFSITEQKTMPDCSVLGCPAAESCIVYPSSTYGKLFWQKIKLFLRKTWTILGVVLNIIEVSNYKCRLKWVWNLIRVEALSTINDLLLVWKYNVLLFQLKWTKLSRIFNRVFIKHEESSLKVSCSLSRTDSHRHVLHWGALTYSQVNQPLWRLVTVVSHLSTTANIIISSIRTKIIEISFVENKDIY